GKCWSIRAQLNRITDFPRRQFIVAFEDCLVLDECLAEFPNDRQGAFATGACEQFGAPRLTTSRPEVRHRVPWAPRRESLPIHCDARTDGRWDYLARRGSLRV